MSNTLHLCIEERRHIDAAAYAWTDDKPTRRRWNNLADLHAIAEELGATKFQWDVTGEPEDTVGPDEDGTVLVAVEDGLGRRVMLQKTTENQR